MAWKSLDAARSGLRRWDKNLIATRAAALCGVFPMALGIIIGVEGIIIGAVMACSVGPEWFSFTYWQEGGQSVSRSEVLRNVGLLIVGLVGLAFGIWRAWTAHRQAHTSRQGHFTDRFSTAVKHLGSKELPVRLGGVYALWRLAEDSADRDEKSVWDILCAFIRHPPHEPGEEGKAPKETEVIPVRPDIQAILDLLTTSAAACQRKKAGYFLKLNRSNLQQADLSGANLSGTNLSNANLTGAYLNGAYLTDANLSFADLTDAMLIGADLTNANLIDANLIDANLSGANLNDAILDRRELERRVPDQGH